MNKNSISLVLGGGGARGLTHIGAIEAIEEAGYEIKSISGTSIGAIIGGLHAAGKLDLYKEWVLSLDRFDLVRLLDISLLTNGIIQGEKVFNKLETFVKDQQIEDLPIPFSAVATDITVGKEYWFQKGSLLTAMRASMAIPNIFTPVTVNGRVYVDGGVTNPVPVTPTLSDDTALTIAIQLNGEVEEDPLHEKVTYDAEESAEHSLATLIRQYFSYSEEESIEPEQIELDHLDIFQNSLDIMQESISRFKLASTPPDLTIEIPKNICGILEFHKAEALIAFGKERTRKRLSALASKPV